MGTVVICILLVCLVTAIIIKLVKDKKKGKSSCGNKCSACPMSGKCHMKK